MPYPVVKGVAYGLAHAPSLVRYGSKPYREIDTEGDTLLGNILSHLRSYEEAVAYPPNQVVIGNLAPDDLLEWPGRLTENLVPDARSVGPHGSIISERELYARMLRDDHFNLLQMEDWFAAELQAIARDSWEWQPDQVEKLKGHPPDAIRGQITEDQALPLFVDKTTLIGCFRRDHLVDEALTATVLMENLACKACGVQALEYLLSAMPNLPAAQVQYLIGCGEEAVGDRYQRGGGNIAKAIGEDTGCVNATGVDVKSFCCAPVHGLVIAASLVETGVFSNVVVVGGSSVPKLGMKFRGHLRHDMPIVEDVLGSLAVWVGTDDGVNPQLRLDVVGRHPVGARSSAEAIAESNVLTPLDSAGLKLCDVDKYAVEMHNPEATEPAGSGNVPLTNYRTLAAMAVLRGEIARGDMPDFIRRRGMPGFAPTQGHIPSAVSYLGHARDAILAGALQRVMFVAKGSLFLGRMTELSDGISILLERNGSLP